ncbi:MAG: cytochrome P450 [Deltaproteobacteria bacterium]|nr:cytochrome P450 [Deltaproteobacteria bacterium]
MGSMEEFLAKAIDPREFDSAAFQRDPFPIYKRLRDDHPAYHDRFHNRWIISRYHDVVAAFQDNDGYDRAIHKPGGPYKFGAEHVFGPNILEYGNSPQHRFLRNVVAGQFVGNRLDVFIPVIEKIAGELIDKLLGRGEVELVEEFTHQFPIRVISNMLGLPRQDEDRFVGWYQALIAGLGFGGIHLARGIQARNEMWEYLTPLIEERRARPGEDLLSRIIAADQNGVRMSDAEIKGFVALLLAAGGDTTDKAIANMWFHMLYTRPDQFEDVKKDPSLWSNVFSEMMRYDPVVHMQFRRTTREIELHGKVIPERASITLYLGAGNRDERAFKAPDTFDIHRDDLHMGRENRSGKYLDGKNGHLGFGIGQHFCMGYAMARQETVIACTKLAEALKSPRPKHAQHEGIVAPSIDSGGFRSPRELWIEYDA